MNTLNKTEIEQIWSWLNEIEDPEIPVISVVELGVVREIVRVGEQIQVSITPTYSGCPAMYAMKDAIHNKLQEKGLHDVVTKTVLFPPWTTDWMSEAARQKLKEYGIAPPENTSLASSDHLRDSIPCPYCDARETRLQSAFGSTACKALYYCDACQQPFEHFKCI